MNNKLLGSIPIYETPFSFHLCLEICLIQIKKITILKQMTYKKIFIIFFFIIAVPANANNYDTPSITNPQMYLRGPVGKGPHGDA